MKTTIKKNQTNRYVSAMQKIFDLFNSGKAFIFTLSAIVVALLNIWLTTQLAPVVKNIDDLAIQVNANTRDVGICYSNINAQADKINEIGENVSYIRGLLDAKK